MNTLVIICSTNLTDFPCIFRAPHAHILIWIKDFPGDPHTIDNIISAEIPNKNDDEELHNLVIKLMIHGPCGATYNRTNLGCIANSRDGSCLRNFPKPYQSATEIGDGAYAQLRRRPEGQGGFTGKKMYKGTAVTVDNRWVVPYSPYLLRKYGMHCNLESCATVSSVKYLFGYNYKGEDMITIEERYMNDEVGAFEVRRYISACSAYWRLAEFDMQTCYPSVYTMPIHLPGKQIITYTPTTSNARHSVERNSRTRLTAYFEKNAEESEEGELARTLTYEDFGTLFTWKDETRVWTKRQRGDTIGRMVSVLPGDDRFYLHLLLKHKKGAVSFNDLKTVDGEEYDTFKGKSVYVATVNCTK